jgi:hypothetical protein
VWLNDYQLALTRLLITINSDTCDVMFYFSQSLISYNGIISSYFTAHHSCQYEDTTDMVQLTVPKDNRKPVVTTRPNSLVLIITLRK